MTKRSKKTKQVRPNSELISALLTAVGWFRKTKTGGAISADSYGIRPAHFNRSRYINYGYCPVYNGPLSRDELKQLGNLPASEVRKMLTEHNGIQETIEHIFDLMAQKIAVYPKAQLKELDRLDKQEQARKEAARKQAAQEKKRIAQEKKRLQAQEKVALASKTKGEAFFKSLTNEQRHLIKAMFKDE